MNCSREWYKSLIKTLLISAAAWLIPCVLVAQSTATDTEFVYRTHDRDTLIGISKRLLKQPQRWSELQTRNHIVEPRHIQPGTAISIPYGWLRTNAETASVIAVTGTVQYDGKNITKGQTLPVGAVIETGADGSVTLVMPDESTVTLQKSSVLKLETMEHVNSIDNAHSARFKLESGRIETHVKPQRDMGRFEIITPVAISAVRGTQFRASYGTDTDSATTETLEGAVNVAAHGDAVIVPSGFGTRVASDGPPLRPMPLLSPPDLSAVPAINTQAELHIALRPVTAAKEYRVQLATDANFQSIIFDSQSDATNINLGHVVDRSYWLRARCIDQLGIEGLDAVISVTQRTLPPAPSPTLPKSDAHVTGNTTQFDWITITAGNHYHVQVARNADFSDVVIDRDSVDGAQLIVERIKPGKYFWHVATVTVNGVAGEWSEAHSFTQQIKPPVSELPIIQKKLMTFHWTEVSAQAYRVQIAKDLHFDRIVLDTTVTAASLATNKLSVGRYYIRLQVIEHDGSSSEFGEPRRFDVPLPLWAKILIPIVMVTPFL